MMGRQSCFKACSMRKRRANITAGQLVVGRYICRWALVRFDERGRLIIGGYNLRLDGLLGRQREHATQCPRAGFDSRPADFGRKRSEALVQIQQDAQADLVLVWKHADHFWR